MKNKVGLFLISFVSCVVCCCILIIPFKHGDTSLPAIGPFFSLHHGFWQNAESTTPDPEKIFDLNGLEDEVVVQYDDRWVPHIFAQNIGDANYVQGFIHAQNRLFQMDISTRSAGGRLTELVGKRALEVDKLARRRGMDLAADQCIEGWQKFPEYYKYVEKYTEGVNAYIKSLKPRDYPVEYKILGASPSEWTPKRTALFVKAMAKDLCFRNEDIQASNTLNFWGEADFKKLYPQRNPKDIPIIPSTEDMSVFQESGEFISFPGFEPSIVEEDMPDEGIGSNNWAVNSAKSTTGGTILANDPHLKLTLPSIWFEIHIQTPELEAYGASLPGLPNVILGFNRHIAWGITNGGHDVLDWYKIDWVDETKSAYWYDGEQESVERRVEEFDLGGGKMAYDTVTYTRWGPMTYEKRDDDMADLAMHWIAVQEPVSPDVATFMELNRAKNHEEYRSAIVPFISPMSNLIFASDQDEIALTVLGKLPLKKEGQGRFIQDGSKSTNDWDGFIPFEDLPHIVNPDQEFIVSANQLSTDTNYPYYYNGGFADYRGRYLNKKMREKEKFSIEDMKSLQNDSYSLLAEEGLQALIHTLDIGQLSSEQSEIVDVLRKWDFIYEKTKWEPIFFELWFTNFRRMTFDELKDQKNILYPEFWRTIELIISDSTSHYFDIQETEQIEQKEDIVYLSFLAAEKKFNELEHKRWDAYKGTVIEHIARIPGFDSGVLSVGGSRYAPNAISERNGPSWRLIVSFGDTMEALGIIPGGQSGNPGSPFYDNTIQDWIDGNYYNLHFPENIDDLGFEPISKHQFIRKL